MSDGQSTGGQDPNENSTGRQGPSGQDARSRPTPGRRIAAWARRRGSRWVRLLRLLPHAGLPLVLGGVVLALVLAIAPLAVIVLLGRLLGLVGAAVAGTPDPAAGWWDDAYAVLGVAVAVLVVQQVLAPYLTGLVEVASRRIDQYCIDRLLRASLGDAPVSALESPEALDILADARAAFSRWSRTPGEAAAALVPLLSRYVQLVGAAVLVGVVTSPAAGLLIGLTALGVRFGVRGTLGRYGLLFNSLAGHRRKVAYLRDLATTSAVTKEVRLLGILPWLRARLRADTLAQYEPLWAGSRRLQFWPFVGFAGIALVGGAVVLGLVADAAATGAVGLFGLGVALQAVLVAMRFGVYFPECDVQTQYGLQSFEALERFEALIAEGTAPRSVLAPPPAPATSIRFEGVGFRYGDDAPWVLRGLDLTIDVGRSTALVGLNGAGKTTLVKLLARLYQPTEGRITVDGVDLADVDAAAWQQHLALIFQDYVRYELTAGENIGFGAPHLLDDDAALLDAATRAGAAELVGSLADGLRTELSSRYTGGRDLSGGQWQRVALARALLAVRGGASVLVLDEPTAQLDVRAEAEFFDRFLATAHGVTSLVISHRFSTLRHAYQIVVLEHGAVVEQGDHAELMALDGRYAHLFELQAQRFRTPGAATGSGASTAAAAGSTAASAATTTTTTKETVR
ncbi:ATP-binding cassette subfamily B protein [Sediminihabitans luteus]|uniref:ATP-binding cassette subfamily B protein n=1 Tax=Sediminihabitans luteus TaxID=1138585 RepID=A0A2M9CYS8_9CELL|nr:ATP-binding cassette domain-containing protein [Sediminihabitans luteus]PJJ77089.1 ATP-binding cassette subfamily B protein [Sediminihabitans luteus]GIJ00392.1 multidrug ABC transporter permease [Sediminihabitans luteus]